jgi:hypothetical protein
MEKRLAAGTSAGKQRPILLDKETESGHGARQLRILRARGDGR